MDASEQVGQPAAPGTPVSSKLWVWLKSAGRYFYIVTLTVVILVLVIITLAAYRFQNDLIEAEKTIRTKSEAQAPYFAQQLLDLHSKMLLWERYRDASWSAF